MSDEITPSGFTAFAGFTGSGVAATALEIAQNISPEHLEMLHHAEIPTLIAFATIGMAGLAGCVAENTNPETMEKFNQAVMNLVSNKNKEQDKENTPQTGLGE